MMGVLEPSEEDEEGRVFESFMVDGVRRGPMRDRCTGCSLISIPICCLIVLYPFQRYS